MSTGPTIKRGVSKQDYRTPTAFLEAVSTRFGPIDCDLACEEHNKVAPIGVTKSKHDSLLYPWDLCLGNCWLNPPFNRIQPWAEKCFGWHSLNTRIFLLVPASVGSNWFANWVHQKSLVLFLSPRLKFVGADDPYPKDLMLCCFGVGRVGYECWRWNTDNKIEAPPPLRRIF